MKGNLMFIPDFIILFYNSVSEFAKSALIILFQGDHFLPWICSSILALTFCPLDGDSFAFEKTRNR